MQGWRPARSSAWCLVLVFWIVHSNGTAGQGGSPSAPPTLPRPAASGLSIVLGQVIDGSDGRPVASAIVSLMSPSGGSGASRVLADSQGRFAFSSLPAGSFGLTATATGYTSGAYGQSRPGGSTRPLILLPDQKLGGVTIRLWKFAAVTGTVVDEAGDPVTGTSVRALRRVVSGRSVRLLATGQIGSTDDRGIYRLSGLTQGEYLIMLPSSTTTMPVSTIDAMQTIQAAGSGESDRLFAEQLNASGAPYPNSSGVRVGDAYLQPGAMQGPGVGAFTSDRGTLVQPPIFFANAATAGTASIVALGPGEEKSGVDFQLNPVVARTVSGTLTGADGTVGNLGVRLVPANVDDFSSDSGMEVATTITGEQGQFTFLAVPPGSYVVRVLRIPRPALPNMIPGPNGSMQMAPRPPAGPPTEPTLFAQMPITVGDADLRGLSVALKTGPHVSGQVEFDGTPSAQSASRPQLITVNLTPADGRSLPGLMPAVAAVDGSFTTMSVPPGRYLINANTPGWILRSATANGRDASETPIDLESTDIGGVTITFFNRPAQVSGTVHDSRGNADDAASVLLFPADYRTWMQDGMSSRRYRTVQTTTNGRFSMSGLMPGDYLLVAVHDAQGPEIVEAVAPLALHVSLGESANQTQDLTSVQVPIR